MPRATMTTRVANVESIGSYFESLSDPRHPRNRKHRLIDIVVIAVCGLVCGCDGPTAIHRWAANRREWLDGFLPLPNGLPSRDCIRRVLIALQPEAFQRCFRDWIADALEPDETAPARLIAIDGKTCRRSHDTAHGLGPLHIVSAWASEHGIALGQVATEEKSNEITAIPLLLKQVELAKAVVTIDAMGCQKDIARDIVAGGGDFVIAVKDNQPKLSAAIGALVMRHLEGELDALRHRSYATAERGHGRRDERSYFVAQVPSDFTAREEWPWIKAIGTAVRITTHPDGSQTDEVRYYMLSRFLSGKRFGEAVRGHWGIESMHWVLDVTFREDDSRIRERTLANNLSWLRRFAVTLLKRHPIKDSIRGKMIRCLMNTQFLTEVLSLQ
jgi:predicted transposase YbfD/YdcC